VQLYFAENFALLFLNFATEVMNFRVVAFELQPTSGCEMILWCFVSWFFPPLRFAANLLWLPNLFLSLKEVLSTVQKSSTFCKGHLKQTRNIRMGFLCVCWITGSVGHSSDTLPASWHPRLLWELNVAPRSTGIVPASGPSQLTGRRSETDSRTADHLPPALRYFRKWTGSGL